MLRVPGSFVARSLDRRLMFAVELLESERGAFAGSDHGGDELKLDAMMIRVVVCLAKQYKMAARESVLQRRGIDESRARHVPNATRQRMVCQTIVAVSSKHAAGHDQTARDARHPAQRAREPHLEPGRSIAIARIPAQPCADV